VANSHRMGSAGHRHGGGLPGWCVSARRSSSVGICVATLRPYGGSDSAARRTSRTRTVRQRGPLSARWIPVPARCNWCTSVFQTEGSEFEARHRFHAVVTEGQVPACKAENADMTPANPVRGLRSRSANELAGRVFLLLPFSCQTLGVAVRSSTGRAADSKSARWGFESLRACRAVPSNRREKNALCRSTVAGHGGVLAEGAPEALPQQPTSLCGQGEGAAT
jgi:hypothetical protein